MVTYIYKLLDRGAISFLLIVGWTQKFPQTLQYELVPILYSHVHLHQEIYITEVF